MKERPILMSGPMVRASLREVDPKTQTRRVVKVPKHIKPDGLMLMTWDRHDASLREQGVGDDARPYLTGPRWEGERLFGNLYGDVGYGVIACPYGEPGDRLWVRETFQYESRTEDHSDEKDCLIRYRATEPDAGPWIDAEDNVTDAWRPSIHMPRWASRLTLEITGVRVQQLQEISEEDSNAEGCGDGFSALFPRTADGFERNLEALTARSRFYSLWDSLNAKRGHGSGLNPWVWALTFARVT